MHRFSSALWDVELLDEWNTQTEDGSVGQVAQCVAKIFYETLRGAGDQVEALERTLGLPAVPPAVEADDRARLEAQVPSGPSDGAPPAFASSAPSASAAAAGSEEPEMDFFKVMGFGAPAPEVINGRAAMVAFLAAAGAELATHDSVFKQLGEGGLGGMLFVFAAVTAASFAPVLRGKSSDEAFLKNSKPEEFGPFNAQAEMLNGRAAMMGLLFLLAAEASQGKAFF